MLFKNETNVTLFHSLRRRNTRQILFGTIIANSKLSLRKQGTPVSGALSFRLYHFRHLIRGICKIFSNVTECT